MFLIFLEEFHSLSVLALDLLFKLQYLKLKLFLSSDYVLRWSCILRHYLRDLEVQGVVELILHIVSKLGDLPHNLFVVFAFGSDQFALQVDNLIDYLF